jgi:hypothetical protein
MYATGTNDKAFLHATWKMSPQEIQRANKASLSQSEMWFLFAPQVTDRNRLKSFIQENLSMWGNTSKVEYIFFDEMLYEYCITFTIDQSHKEITHKEILETPRGQFREEKQLDNSPEIYSYRWDTDKQTIQYLMLKNKEGQSFFVQITATYKPFYSQIEEVIKKEKKTYF